MALGLVLAVTLSVGGLYFTRFYHILILNDFGASVVDFSGTGSGSGGGTFSTDAVITGGSIKMGTFTGSSGHTGSGRVGSGRNIASERMAAAAVGNTGSSGSRAINIEQLFKPVNTPQPSTTEANTIEIETEEKDKEKIH